MSASCSRCVNIWRTPVWSSPDERTLREQLSTAGRRAVRARQWQKVDACGRDLLRHGGADAEGYFLLGLAAKSRHEAGLAMREFARAAALDRRRYDAAVELAGLYQTLGAHGEAVYRLRACEDELRGSPYYLDMAGTIFTRAGLPAEAYRLYSQADVLQPGVDSLRAKLAAACVHVGRHEEARSIYLDLLAKNPQHQRNHHELSRLVTARDHAHVERMLSVLRDASQAPADNIYLYYALGKEYEDLGEWDSAFDFYRKAGDAAASVANYDVSSDIRLIDTVIATGTAAWLTSDVAPPGVPARTPLFVVGLPRAARRWWNGYCRHTPRWAARANPFSSLRRSPTSAEARTAIRRMAKSWSERPPHRAARSPSATSPRWTIASVTSRTS